MSAGPWPIALELVEREITALHARIFELERTREALLKRGAYAPPRDERLYDLNVLDERGNRVERLRCVVLEPSEKSVAPGESIRAGGRRFLVLLIDHRSELERPMVHVRELLDPAADAELAREYRIPECAPRRPAAPLHEHAQRAIVAGVPVPPGRLRPATLADLPAVAGEHLPQGCALLIDMDTRLLYAEVEPNALRPEGGQIVKAVAGYEASEKVATGAAQEMPPMARPPSPMPEPVAFEPAPPVVGRSPDDIPF